MRKIAVAVLAGVVLLGGISDIRAAGLLPRAEEQFRVFADQRTPASEVARLIAILEAIAVHVRDDYVDAVDSAQMEEGAIGGMLKIGSRPGATNTTQLFEAAADGMLTSLDIHSSYLSPQDFKEMQVQSSGRFAGLGISVSLEEGLLKVISPLDGTPAFRAGVQPGDIVTHIDGQLIAGWTLAQAVGRMRGEVGSRVRLTIDRQGRVFDVPLVREIITINTVTWRREGEVGYIRITDFQRRRTAD